MKTSLLIVLCFSAVYGTAAVLMHKSVKHHTKDRPGQLCPVPASYVSPDSAIVCRWTLDADGNWQHAHEKRAR